MPWWSKIAAKLVLARLPFSYQLWQRLALFRHGAMDDADYALNCFRRHFEAAGRPGAEAPLTALELGPGDSLASALVCRAFGGETCWLVDSGDFARRDLVPYRQMARQLAQEGMAAPDLHDADTVDDMLEICGAHYLTNGLDGLRSIPDASVTFIWSQAVLEHVRRREFAETLVQLRRIVADGGICSHRVDLRDHLGGALNNLRFSDAVWENDMVATSGFYTNRIGYAEMLDCFQQAGFAVVSTSADRWQQLPTPRGKLAAPFRDRPETDLLVSGFDVLLRPA